MMAVLLAKMVMQRRTLWGLLSALTQCSITPKARALFISEAHIGAAKMSAGGAA
jgi:hypothetical protein